MTATVLNTYVGIRQTSHTIDLGTPTAGRDIIVIVAAAAGITGPGGDWVTDDYEISSTAGAIFRLPAADNDGTTTSMGITLSGPRQACAVILEDILAAAPTVVSASLGYVDSTTIVAGPYTQSQADVAMVILCTSNGGGDTTLPQALSSWSGSLTALADSGTSAVDDEDSRVYVGYAEDRAFSAESVTATFAATWNHAAATFYYGYSEGTVSEVSTTTTLTADPTDPDDATNVTLTATVVPSGATGTATFYDDSGATELGSEAVSGGVAELTGQAFDSGTHNLSVSFDGTDGSWGDSSDTLDLEVTAAGSSGTPLIVYPTLRQAVGSTSYRVLTTADGTGGGGGSTAERPWQFLVSDYGAVGDGTTDDTAAIQAAIDAAVAYAIGSGNYVGEVIFDDAVYQLDSAISDTAVTGGGIRGQLRLPHRAGADPKVTLILTGASVGAPFSHWLSTEPHHTGTTLRSSLTGQSSGSVGGATIPPSVIGAPRYADSTTFSNLLVVVRGITVAAPFNPSLVGMDLAHSAQIYIEALTCQAQATPIYGSSPHLTTLPTNSLGVGLITPVHLNNDNNTVISYASEGFYTGVAFGEHFAAHRLAIIYGVDGIYVYTGNNGNHGSWIGYASVEACTNVLVADPASTSPPRPISVEVLDVEPAAGGSTHVLDPYDALCGYVGITDNVSVDPVVSGGKHLNIRSLRRDRGAATAPSVPSSGTALQNPFWRDAVVAISGGTVTAIALDGVATGLTSGAIVVPSGVEVTLTYSAAPSWTWTLA